MNLVPKMMHGQSPSMLCAGRNFISAYFAGFETFGTIDDHYPKFDKVEPAVCDAGVYGLYNLRVEQDSFDCAYVDLTTFGPSTEKSDPQRDAFLWSFNKVREAGIMLIQGTPDQLVKQLDSICYRLDRPTIQHHGNLVVVAGIVKPSNISGSYAMHSVALVSRTKNRLAVATLYAAIKRPEELSLLAENYVVERTLSRSPGFFTTLVTRNHVGSLLLKRPHPLSHFDHHTHVNTKQIEIPKEFSVGNFAKLAADGQMDGLMNGKDGSTVLVKGFVKQVTTESSEDVEAANGETVSEKVKLTTNQVFVYGLYLEHAEEERVGNMFVSRLA